MTSYRFETLEPSPLPSVSLAVLETAAHRATACAGRPAGRCVRAAVDSRSPDEGLALLNAYVAIADRDVRQAILDVVLAISPIAPRG